MEWVKYRLFLRFVADETSRSKWSLNFESFKCAIQYNIGLIDYFLFRFYNKNAAEKNEWAGTGFMYEYHLMMNPLSTRGLLADKIRFYEAYADFVQHPNCTIADLKANNENARKVLDNPSRKIVLKDALGQCGWGIEVIDAKKFSLEELLVYMLKKEFNLVEAFIQQHPVLENLSNAGLNTLRVITQVTDDGEVDFLGARLRITINAQVDNMASGNMAAPVDMDTGMVTGPGVFSDITKLPLQIHPVSGIAIQGTLIPFWPEILELTRKAALHHPENRSVGWDVAITEHGASLIEGNHNWCKLLWQLPVNKGLKNVLVKYMAE